MQIKFTQTAEDTRREWAGDFKPAKVAPLEVLPVLKTRPNMTPFWLLVGVVFVAILSLGLVL